VKGVGAIHFRAELNRTGPACAAIARIAGGDFRLLHPFVVQIERILKIDGLNIITMAWSRSPGAPS
jgi:hypothetical protein